MTKLYWDETVLSMTVPLQVFAPDAQVLTEHAQLLGLSLWIPWPLPSGWQVAGHGYVGEPVDAAATVLACRGPHPLGSEAEVADLLVVAEEPGTGLGSALAGTSSADPGPDVGRGSPHIKTSVGGRPTSLWWVPSAAPDRAVYAGEAAGRWLWLVLHPDSAGVLVAEGMQLADVRDLGHEVDLLPYGNLSPRLDLRTDLP